MALDLEAIRKRIQQLNNGGKKTSSYTMWKPDVGEYKVRLLPWKSTPDGVPFLERWIYYIGDNRPILAPYQFGKADPIQRLQKKLYSSGKEEDKKIAKSLNAKMQAYAPLIVRGNEEAGIMLWSFSKTIYNKLLNYFVDDEVGPITDPTEGWDLKVVVTKVPGKKYLDKAVEASRKPSKLSDDPNRVKALLAAVPDNIDDMWDEKSEAEIESILNDWLAAGAPIKDDFDTSTKKEADVVDKLAAEVSEAKSTSTKRKKVDVDSDTPKQSLEDAFKDLMSAD